MNVESIKQFYETHKVYIIFLVIAIITTALIWYATRRPSHQSKWWCHQTVKFRPSNSPISTIPSTTTSISEGQIELKPHHAEVPPPKNLRWDNKIPTTQEFTQFINTYYDQNTTYPPEYINSLLQDHPNTNIILLRDENTNQIRASMLLRPINITVRRRKIPCHYIDLLCIHPELRKKGINEKMMDKLLHTLNDKPNDICIYQIDKRPLPYEPTAKLQNYLLDLSHASQTATTNQASYLPTANFELKTYNGEPELTKLLTATSSSALDTSPHNLTQNFTPEEFQNYFTTDPNFRISFYQLSPNSPKPNFCAVYLLDTKSSKRLAEIINFQGPPEFLKQVIQKLKTLNVSYVNALESTTLRPTSHLLPLSFRPSEPTFIHMHNYRTKQQISPEQVNFNQP